MSGYTVIDVETTGLSPERHDRVVEVGVVYVSDDGEIQDFRLSDQPAVSLRALGPRTLEEVPPAELAEAMHLAERDHGAISDEEIMRTTLWLYGRKSLTQAARDRLDPVLALVRQEEIGAVATAEEITS